MMFHNKNRFGSSGKIGNEKVSLDGYSFSSKLEAAVYQLLRLRMKAGEIKSIQVQDHVYLSDARIGYVADFRCEDHNGNSFHVEAKGFETERWPIKKKLYKFYGPDRLEIWKGTWQKPYLDEVVTPHSKKSSQPYCECCDAGIEAMKCVCGKKE